MIAQLWVIIGFLYALLVFFKYSPKEETEIRHIGDLITLAVTGVGITLLWPLVVYVNHFWNPPEEYDGF